MVGIKEWCRWKVFKTYTTCKKYNAEYRCYMYQERQRGKPRPPTNSPIRCDFRINILAANIMFTCMTYTSPITQDLNSLDFDLSMPLKSPDDGGVELSIHDFLFGFSSNTLPNLVHLQSTSLINLNNTSLYLSRSPNVKCNFSRWLPITLYSKHMYNFHILATIGPWKISSYILSFGQNFGQPMPTLPQRVFSQNRTTSWFKVKAQTKHK